jgi:hypothetical protein
MMRALLPLVFVFGCGDNRPEGPVDAALVFEGGADAGGGLFGEACTQPAFPEIGICHDGEGGCNDEAGGAVCRPFCHIDGEPQCEARGGVETITDRGACVCTPQ